MDNLSAPLLNLILLGYVTGAAAASLFLRAEKLANLSAFGCASLASLCGIVSSAVALATGAAATNQSVELLPSLIPYIKFTIRLDPLGAFFLLIVSLLGFALSIYSLGYARGFFGRKNVGVLGALFNVLLLATTLTFVRTTSGSFSSPGKSWP
jgi:hydrogenase-4 component B